MTLINPPPLMNTPTTVCWRSIEWISLYRALFPLTIAVEAKHLVLPRCFVLACLSFLGNWTAYASRIETYSCLGYSRRVVCCSFDSVGSVCLSPFSMMCNQCLCFDGWPLWLSTQLLRWLCSGILWFSTKHLTKRGEPSTRLHHFFSTVDEI